jgi:uncharacterized protein (DUF362 family)
MRISRRTIFRAATAAAASMLANRGALAQNINLAGEAAVRPRTTGPHPDGWPPNMKRSTVSLIKGDASRRKNVTDALVAINEQIVPVLKTKKYVMIKPNALGTTHVDALRGILDYLAPRFKGPVVIAECATGDTTAYFEKAGFPELIKEYGKHVSLVDLADEGKYVIEPLLDYDLHVVPARLAARFFDPEAYILGSANFKVHNIAVVTLAVKNMVLGAPLHQSRKEAAEKITWLDKRRYHAGIRQSLYNIYHSFARMQPGLGATVIDGYEGRENGGVVPSHCAIASTDYVAADRIGSEAMGVNHEWLGWLMYLGQTGVGQWELEKIDLRGNKLEEVRKEYRLHADIELELQWRGPMQELPKTLGWVTPLDPKDYDA